MNDVSLCCYGGRVRVFHKQMETPFFYLRGKA
jgi:hypothetical protein